MDVRILGFDGSCASGRGAGSLRPAFKKGAHVLRTKLRVVLSVAMGIGILLGLLVLPGCSDEGAGSLPETKAKRDEAQKAREVGPGGNLPPAGKSNRP